MKWVKATDRLPMFAGEQNKVIVKGSIGGNAFVAFGYKNFNNENPQMYYCVGNKSYCDNDVIWLDETE